MSDAPETVDGDVEEQPELTAEETIAEAAAKAAADAGMVPRDVSDADEYKPSATDLVAVERDDAFRAMDRTDEIQILDELQGRALDVMLYSYEEAGVTITDLSYAGVREVVRTLNRERYTAIRTSPDHPPALDEIREDGADYYVVKIYAADVATGSGQWGVALEPKRMKLKDQTAERWRRKGREVAADNTVWDKFSLTKCLSKAQRNAMKSLLPVEFVEVIKAQFLGDSNRVRKIAAGPGAEALAELPPPLDDDLMKELQNTARERYLVLKDLNRLAMLPARFNYLMTASAHDHQRTRDFIDHIESLIELEETERAKREAGV